MANARVAILDADQAAKDYISDVLELAGYITVSEVGMAGFSRLVETNRVDLVLMCARSASQSTLSRLGNIGNVWRGPIFVLSDADTLSDEVDFLDGGADSWLAMPFRLKELLAMMNSLLRRTQPLEYRIEGILRPGPRSHAPSARGPSVHREALLRERLPTHHLRAPARVRIQVPQLRDNARPGSSEQGLPDEASTHGPGTYPQPEPSCRILRLTPVI